MREPRPRSAARRELGLGRRNCSWTILRRRRCWTDLPVQLRSGAVLHLTSDGLPGVIHLPELSAQLYRSARWLRVFTARQATVSRQRVLALLAE